MRLVTVLRPDLHPVRVDPGQIDQVILNLAVNARDAMPHGGAFTLETSEVERESTNGEIPPGRYILLTVSDTGTGMTPEVQARIFEPFFTTKSQAKERAWACRSWMASSNKAGATSRSTARRAGAPRSKSTCRRSMSPQRRRHRAPLPSRLGAARRSCWSKMSTRASHHRPGAGKSRLPGVASSEWRGGLALGGKCREKIHLLMTDVVMPGMSGRDLADALRARDPGLKVLFQSGYTADVVVRHDVLHAEMAFLQKPFRRGPGQKGSGGLGSAAVGAWPR